MAVGLSKTEAHSVNIKIFILLTRAGPNLLSGKRNWCSRTPHCPSYRKLHHKQNESIVSFSKIFHCCPILLQMNGTSHFQVLIVLVWNRECSLQNEKNNFRNKYNFPSPAKVASLIFVQTTKVISSIACFWQAFFFFISQKLKMSSIHPWNFLLVQPKIYYYYHDDRTSILLLAQALGQCRQLLQCSQMGLVLFSKYTVFLTLIKYLACLLLYPSVWWHHAYAEVSQLLIISWSESF